MPCRTKPSLPEDKKKRQVDLVCDEVDKTIGKPLGERNVTLRTNPDETRYIFFPGADKGMGRIFSGEAMPGVLRDNHKSKSHLPKTTRLGQIIAGFESPNLRFSES